MMPALRTTASSLPHFASAFSTTLRLSSSLQTSPWCTISDVSSLACSCSCCSCTSESGSVREMVTTLAAGKVRVPWRRSEATLRPRPREAPVTSTTGCVETVMVQGWEGGMGCMRVEGCVVGACAQPLPFTFSSTMPRPPPHRLSPLLQRGRHATVPTTRHLSSSHRARAVPSSGDGRQRPTPRSAPPLRWSNLTLIMLSSAVGASVSLRSACILVFAALAALAHPLFPPRPT